MFDLISPNANTNVPLHLHVSLFCHRGRGGRASSSPQVISDGVRPWLGLRAVVLGPRWLGV